MELTTTELMEIFEISRNSVLQWLKDGRWKTAKNNGFPKGWTVEKSEVLEWVANQKQSGLEKWAKFEEKLTN